MDNARCKTFEYLIGNPISSFGTNIPRQIDVLRFFFSFPIKKPDSSKISEILKQIENCYRARTLRIQGTEAIRLKIKRLIKNCKDLISKRKNYRTSNVEKVKQEKFHRDIHGVFQVLGNNSTSIFNVSNEINLNETQNFDDSLISVGLNNSANDPDYFPSDDDNDTPKKGATIPHELIAKISDTRGSFRLCQDLLKLGVRISGSDPKKISTLQNEYLEAGHRFEISTKK